MGVWWSWFVAAKKFHFSLWLVVRRQWKPEMVVTSIIRVWCHGGWWGVWCSAMGGMRHLTLSLCWELGGDDRWALSEIRNYEFAEFIQLFSQGSSDVGLKCNLPLILQFIYCHQGKSPPQSCNLTPKRIWLLEYLFWRFRSMQYLPMGLLRSRYQEDIYGNHICIILCIDIQWLARMKIGLFRMLSHPTYQSSVEIACSRSSKH
jgi:hypothetical protein